MEALNLIVNIDEVKTDAERLIEAVRAQPVLYQSNNSATETLKRRPQLRRSWRPKPEIPEHIDGVYSTY